MSVGTKVAQPIVISGTGLKPLYTACSADGDQFLNSGRDFIHIKNGAVSPQTVTAVGQTPCNEGSLHDLVIAIPASEERMIGPLPTTRFNDVNGYVQLTYSAVVTLTIAIIRLP